jgi:3-demethoxyubiquinol 3-hydroxylase
LILQQSPHFLNNDKPEPFMRELNKIDQLMGNIDSALRTLCPPKQRSSQRPNPGETVPQARLNTKEKQHIAGLMRVNHAGEVCAQALYQGQALTAKLTHVKAQMIQAAEEEVDHLAWCEQRLNELNSKPSRLNIIWYTGSLLLGAVAGLAGDRWSLGFVAETEHQVSAHLQDHLQKIPKQDLKTKAILTQMHNDEAHHAELAQAAGAAELPRVIKRMMQCASKLLTRSSYYF